MTMDVNQQELLKKLPGVDTVMEQILADESFRDTPRRVIVQVIRTILDDCRKNILESPGDVSEEMISGKTLLSRISRGIQEKMTPNLRRTVNATGVVIHTNLGRSLLADDAMDHIARVASRYSNLELNLATGKRGLRYSAVDDLICEISGAESALVVNNNAAAVLICLDTLVKGREAIVSRGELVEIGGSFRIPDVMEKSGGVLKEVGTTNRTHPRDYVGAINEKSGLLLKVHTSNYSIQGFTKSVSLSELVEIGKEHSLPVMEDLGSGTFVDFSRYGLAKEPTVQESVAAGCDIITFSGDKLLGGPQAGIILGKKELVDRIKTNPLTRALRIDKMTLAALESTLRLYMDEEKALAAIPTLRMLTMTKAQTGIMADRLMAEIAGLSHPRVDTVKLDLFSRAGGGSLPLLELPSICVGLRIQGLSPQAVEKRFRKCSPPMIARIENDILILDPRTIQEDEPEIIRDIIATVLKDIDA